MSVLECHKCDATAQLVDAIELGWHLEPCRPCGGCGETAPGSPWSENCAECSGDGVTVLCANCCAAYAVPYARAANG